MDDNKENESKMKDSRKRTATDAIGQVDASLPSPTSSQIHPIPKAPRLSATRPSDTPSHLDIAKTLTKAPSTPQTPSKKPTRKHQLATDPINVSIYNLRKEGHGWNDIATSTNAACGMSERNELTATACYSRFFRNGPLVVKEKGEEWRKEWYVHMKGAVLQPKEVGGGEMGEREEGAEGAERQEKVVLEAVETVKAGFWKEVAKVVNESLGGGDNMADEEVKAVYDRVGQGGE